MRVNRPNEQTAAYNLFSGHLRACRRVLWYLCIFSMISNILILTIPIYSLQVLDRVISSGSTDTLMMLTIVVVGALVGLGIIQTVRSYLLIHTGEWLDVKLSPVLFQHSIANKVQASEVSSSSQDLRDLGTIKSFLVGPALTALLDAPWSLFFIFILFAIHPTIGFIILGGGGALLVVAALNEYITKNALNSSSEFYASSINQVEAAARNAEAIEAMGMLSDVTKNWQESNSQGIYLQTIASKRSAILSGFSRFLRFALQVAVIGASAHLVLINELTVGAIIASSILASRALSPFEAAINSWKNFISARKSYSRLKSSLSNSALREEGMKLPAPKGKLDIENIFFVPRGAEDPTIKGLSLKLKPGEILGLIGPSAAGKSTLAKLITGVWKPTTGVVRLDGADVYNWNRNDFGKHVGYLPQDVELFSGSIRDNIARMDKSADSKKVIEAAQTAGVHDMILRLPKGYETEIGAGGAVLSGGQRQRVGLARALYGEPKLLVLDEPNASLDNAGEKALVNALNKAKEKQITTIIISHRPMMMSSADKIMVMKEGTIAAIGSRDEIFAKLNTEVPKQNASVSSLRTKQKATVDA